MKFLVYKYLRSLLLIFIFSACSLSERRILDENRIIQAELTSILMEARTIDDLLSKRQDLERLFNRLVDIAIAAQMWSEKHDECSLDLSEEDYKQSEALDEAMNQTLKIPGAEYLLRDTQAAALEKLDAFEQKRLKRRSGKL